MKTFRASAIERMISSSFSWVAFDERLALFWMTEP
jgi:hypothetical protein